MTATRDRIEDLVVRIQSDFLDNPTLALTQPAAEKRFGIDEVTCAGVLGALEEARVLTEREGAYRRYFPRTGRTTSGLNRRKRLRRHPNPEACARRRL